MNYRHVFHAGNFADVFKHVLLARMLTYLIRKPAPLRFIDTHAGIGRYDLARQEAERTGEWRTGIGRLLQAPVSPHVEALLAPYRMALGSCGEDGRPLSYPGSPAVAQAILRPIDRLTLSERHPDDVVALRRTVRGDRRITVLDQDGYQTLKAVLPPPERRGLVLIDPPFEAADEAETLVLSLHAALRRWASGTFVVWYPIKAPGTTAGLRAPFDAMAPGRHCRIEMLRPNGSGPALSGCGLFVVNPPFGLVDEAGLLLPFLCEALGSANEPPFRFEIRSGDP